MATKTNVTENRFRLWSAAVHMATPRGTRFRSSPLQEAEDAVIRREFFVGLGTLAAAPLSLMPSPNLSCGKSEALVLAMPTLGGLENRHLYGELTQLSAELHA